MSVLKVQEEVETENVCYECAHYIACEDFSPDTTEERDAEIAEAVRKRYYRVHKVHWGYPELEHSINPCPCCGDKLHGTRFRIEAQLYVN